MPPARQENESGIIPLAFESFMGVNTAADRTGVPDEMMAWCDGMIPLAPGNLRTLYGKGSNIYTSTPGIVAFYFYNIGSTPYAAVFQADGSLLQINTITNVVTTILTAGTILSPSITQMGTSQYGEQYLLAVANQTNGYWIWDGSILYTAGTLAPGVVLTSGGAGYASPPIVTASGGHGSGATFVAQVAGGVVTNVMITNPGSGYIVGDTVTLVFTGGTQVGSGGTVTASLSSVTGGSGGAITNFFTLSTIIVGSGSNFTSTALFSMSSISIASIGAGYSSLVSASFSIASHVSFVTATPVIQVYPVGGTLASLAALPPLPATLAMVGAEINFGAFGLAANNFRSLSASQSIITLSSPIGITIAPGYFIQDQSFAVPANTTVVAAQAGISGETFTLSNGLLFGVAPDTDLFAWWPPASNPSIVISDTGFFYVSSVSIVAAGHSYGPNVAINVSGGGSPIQEAVLKPLLNTPTTGSLVSVQIISGGIYQTNTNPTLSVTDSASLAAGTVSLAPYGIQGTAVETYQGHVWVFNGNVFNFTAPGSVSDFSTADGGGSDESNASYLKVGYTNAVSTNGFLFLIGDSSMDYISGVTTTNNTTSFTQNNSDPEVGTPYPAAVTTLGESILVANSQGIFVSSGGTFQKISEMMDGVYNTVPSTNFGTNPFNGFQLSAAKANIFGKRVWMVLVPIVDPVKGTQVNKLLMFRDKKLWWTSEQEVALTFVQGQEINSVYTAWGTDGTNLFRLFNQPSGGFLKIAQSKLWDDPGIDFNKAESRFWSAWRAYSSMSTSISLTMDSIGLDANNNQYTNSQGYSIAGAVSVGYFITPPQAVGQQGVFNGMTLYTEAADVALLKAKIAQEVVQDRT